MEAYPLDSRRLASRSGAFRGAAAAVRLRVAVLAVAFTVAAPRLLAAQPRTVWDGVFSTVQAERGRAGYEQHCGSCHGSDLSGSSGRALAGELFVRTWTEDTVGNLFRKVSTTMPPNATTRPSDAEYADIVAYVMARNGYPPGTIDLPASAAALDEIRIQGREGPGAVPAGALVRTAGCLERLPGGAWRLSGAGEPVRTGSPDASTDAAAAPALARGDLQVGVFGFYPSPDRHVGRLVEIRGFLIRDAGGLRVNATSLIELRSSCAP